MRQESERWVGRASGGGEGDGVFAGVTVAAGAAGAAFPVSKSFADTRGLPDPPFVSLTAVAFDADAVAVAVFV